MSRLPIDPDVPAGGELHGVARTRHLTAQARHAVRARADLLVVIAAGGALGSLARYGGALLMPHRAGEFPWSTLVENVTGSFLLGLTVVVLVELAPSSRYLRPFFGVGVLGGYTTFSTYVLDVQDLLTAGQSALAATYLGGTVLLGLLGVWAGITTGHLGARLVRRGPGRAGGR